MEGIQIIVSDEVIKQEVSRLIKSKILWWHMDDLQAKTGKSINWLKDNILYQPRFKKELEVFTHFPEGSGDKWCFLAEKMEQFLEIHFKEFFVKDKAG